MENMKKRYRGETKMTERGGGEGERKKTHSCEGEYERKKIYVGANWKF